MAKYDEKAKARTMKYMKEKRDKLTLNLPLGDKEKYRAYAESKGKSLTALILELLEADMTNEQKATEPKKGICDIPQDEMLDTIKVIVTTDTGNEYEECYTFKEYLQAMKQYHSIHNLHFDISNNAFLVKENIEFIDDVFIECVIKDLKDRIKKK